MTTVGLGFSYDSGKDWFWNLEVAKPVKITGDREDNTNVYFGVGYNFGRFSDDLTDLVEDDQGAFINLVASF